MLEGPTVGQSVAVSTKPVDIGSHPSSQLRLSEEGGVAGRYARAWLQHDRLILHRLAPGADSAEQAPPEWASLEPNETFKVGAYTILFVLHDALTQNV